MSDTKASAFQSKTAADTASGDLFPFIDISASGNNKNSRITRDELKTAMQAGLGTAALAAAADFATAAQGAKADTALQPGDASIPVFWSATAQLTRDDTPDAATSPADITFTVDQAPADGNTVQFTFNGTAYHFTFALIDPSDGSVWIDCTTLVTVDSGRDALIAALNAQSIASISIANPSGNDLVISNSATGTSASHSFDNQTGSMFISIAGGGTGVNAILHPGTKSAQIKATPGVGFKNIVLGAYITEDSAATWSAGTRIAYSATPVTDEAFSAGALGSSDLKRLWHSLSPDSSAAIANAYQGVENAPLYFHREAQASNGENGAITETCTAYVHGITVPA